MSTLTTRVAGTLVRATTETTDRGRRLVVTTGEGEDAYDVFETADEVGNYSKVVALTEAQVQVIERRVPTTVIADPYWPFDAQV